MQGHFRYNKILTIQYCTKDSKYCHVQALKIIVNMKCKKNIEKQDNKSKNKVAWKMRFKVSRNDPKHGMIT